MLPMRGLARPCPASARKGRHSAAAARVGQDLWPCICADGRASDPISPSEIKRIVARGCVPRAPERGARSRGAKVLGFQPALIASTGASPSVRVMGEIDKVEVSPVPCTLGCSLQRQATIGRVDPLVLKRCGQAEELRRHEMAADPAITVDQSASLSTLIDTISPTVKERGNGMAGAKLDRICPGSDLRTFTKTSLAGRTFKIGDEKPAKLRLACDVSVAVPSKDEPLNARAFVVRQKSRIWIAEQREQEGNGCNHTRRVAYRAVPA